MGGIDKREIITEKIKNYKIDEQRSETKPDFPLFLLYRNISDSSQLPINDYKLGMFANCPKPDFEMRLRTSFHKRPDTRPTGATSGGRSLVLKNMARTDRRTDGRTRPRIKDASSI